MARPNALYIGAAKAGSTWFEQNLRRHPEVFVCEAKDTYFFCRDEVFQRGIAWYERQFQKGAHAQIRIEICHDYLYSSTAPGRIRSMLGEPKLVASLRKPSDRVMSAYAYASRHSQLPGTLADMLYQHAFLWDECRYGKHLRQYLESFSVENFLIVDFCDLERKPEAVWRRVTDFLRISPLALEADLEARVRPRSKARSSTLAQLGKRSARQLRRMEREDLLGRLKRSRFIERALYRVDNTDPIIDPMLLEEFDRAMMHEVADVDSLFGTSLVSSWGLH